MNVSDLISDFSAGYLVLERRGFIHLFKIPERDIIPIVSPVPHENNKEIKKGNFFFTTNQVFAEVLENCFSPSKGRGVSEKIKRLFLEAGSEAHYRSHPYSRTHSIEVWRDDALVGGALILQLGGYVLSISVFNNYNGAGNAAAVFLQKLLVKGGFVVHDSGMRSKISSYFGARYMTQEEVTNIRNTAILMPLDFPTIPYRIAFKQISLLTRDKNGWSFPCEERHAPKGQGGGEEIKDIRQVGARNRSRSEAGATRPGAQSAFARGHRRSTQEQLTS